MHMFSCVILYVFRFLVRVSYLEIYNEEVRDLLGKDQQQRLEVSYRISTQSKSPRWLSGEVPTLRAEGRGGLILCLSCDLKIDTLLTTMPGAWCCRVRARTCWPGVTIL